MKEIMMTCLKLQAGEITTYQYFMNFLMTEVYRYINSLSLCIMDNVFPQQTEYL